MPFPYLAGAPKAFESPPSEERAFMVLSTEAIAEYIALYEKRYGVRITVEEATLRASNLIKLYSIVIGSSLEDITE